MKTPTKFAKNLKNNIVTFEMFIGALYSINKRAKNCRDRVRDLNVEYYHKRLLC